MKIFSLALMMVGLILLGNEYYRVSDENYICGMISDNRAEKLEKLGQQLIACEAKLSAVEQSIIRCIKRENECM